MLLPRSSLNGVLVPLTRTINRKPVNRYPFPYAPNDVGFFFLDARLPHLMHSIDLDC